MLGYLPPEQVKQEEARAASYAKYRSLCTTLYDPAAKGASVKGVSSDDPVVNLFQLIELDVARTHPNGYVKMFRYSAMCVALRRVLFIWAVEHKAISYFQG